MESKVSDINFLKKIKWINQQKVRTHFLSKKTRLTLSVDAVNVVFVFIAYSVAVFTTQFLIHFERLCCSLAALEAKKAEKNQHENNFHCLPVLIDKHQPNTSHHFFVAPIPDKKSTLSKHENDPIKTFF